MGVRPFSAFFLLSCLLAGASSTPLSPLPLHLLRHKNGSGGHPARGLSCRSWRLAVETNNLLEWEGVPPECKDYVGNYMLGHLYREDSQMVVNQAIQYAEDGVTLGADGKDIWIFDIDETSLSNIPFYAEYGFGSEPPNATAFEVWAEKAKAPALPETLRLYNSLLVLGIKPVFLTGRTEESRAATIVNLKEAGYDNWEKLLLRGPDSKESAMAFKAGERRKLVEEGGYRIVGNIGDQWSDILGYPEGDRTFKLPDPICFASPRAIAIRREGGLKCGKRGAPPVSVGRPMRGLSSPPSWLAPFLLLLSLLAPAARSQTFLELFPRGRVADGDGDGLFCESWKFSVEANDAGVWLTIPSRCLGYVREYMTGPRYGADCSVVAGDAFDFAQTVATLRDGEDGKNAWIFDVDETLLSNLPYYEVNGFGSGLFNETSFDEWVDEAIAPAIPASLKFYQQLQQLGFKLVLLTGRSEHQRNATEKNLLFAGYRDWEMLILRGPSDQGKTAVLYKSEKRAWLVSLGYKIYGSSGDQWSDLEGAPIAERSFKLPNPLYYIK
ncbi:hypothetical protein Taro_037251 [Colocasia esculenta]|uniref:Acid phosphatase 1 n=1 Tax=Colocasia esculenta TaxID=4460 RepID=A0A843WP49_COLES|nr:hypothetical protein [Colocasia esculenta]